MRNQHRREIIWNAIMSASKSIKPCGNIVLRLARVTEADDNRYVDENIATMHQRESRSAISTAFHEQRGYAGMRMPCLVRGLFHKPARPIIAQTVMPLTINIEKQINTSAYVSAAAPRRWDAAFESWLYVHWFLKLSLTPRYRHDFADEQMMHV